MWTQNCGLLRDLYETMNWLTTLSHRQNLPPQWSTRTSTENMQATIIISPKSQSLIISKCGHYYCTIRMRILALTPVIFRVLKFNPNLAHSHLNIIPCHMYRSSHETEKNFLILMVLF